MMMDFIPTDSTDKPHLELRCQVDMNLLGLLRDFVCTVARRLQFTEQQVAEIEISVDEACANAMEHAYREGALNQTDVQVELYLSANFMKIRITDQGAGTPDFNVPMSMDSYLDKSREKYRGLGLVLNAEIYG